MGDSVKMAPIGGPGYDVDRLPEVKLCAFCSLHAAKSQIYLKAIFSSTNHASGKRHQSQKRSYMYIP